VEDARERPIGLRSEILCISKLFWETLEY
jgi:hypothetical protein